jgi:hypothetical protein
MTNNLDVIATADKFHNSYQVLDDIAAQFLHAD